MVWIQPSSLFSVVLNFLDQNIGLFELANLMKENDIALKIGFLFSIEIFEKMNKNYDSGKHHRRSIRLQGYDYTQKGAYFVTLCCHNHKCLFDDIIDGKMVKNDAGYMVESVWNNLPVRFNNIQADAFVIMPNHIHGIVIFSGRGESCIRPDTNNIGPEKLSGDHKDRPYGTMPDTLGRVIQAFKSITTHKYVDSVKKHGWRSFHDRLWQRNYYDHIIRSEETLNRIREYIQFNPSLWDEDNENPNIKNPSKHFNPLPDGIE